MKPWINALAACAVAVSAFNVAIAESQQGPPPWKIGTLKVAEATPAPLQLSRSVTLKTAPGQVYDLIAEAENWVRLVAPVTAVSVEDSGGAGSTRRFTLMGDMQISDRVIAADPPKPGRAGVFAWSNQSEGAYSVADHLGAIEILPAEGGGTAVNFYVLYNHDQPDMMAKQFGMIIDGMLANLVYEFGGEKRGATYSYGKIVITQERIVDASAGRAWQVLDDQWGEIDRWASMVPQSEIAEKPGPTLKDAVRSCTVPGMGGLKEAMVRYDRKAMSYTYLVTEGMPPHIPQATNTWRVEAIGDDQHRVTSRMELTLIPDAPAPVAGMTKQQFTQMLDMVIDELAHYVETGEPHPRKLAAMKATASY